MSGEHALSVELAPTQEHALGKGVKTACLGSEGPELWVGGCHGMCWAHPKPALCSLDGHTYVPELYVTTTCINTILGWVGSGTGG